MSHTRRRPDVEGPITLDLDAEDVDLSIDVSVDLVCAELSLTGPAEVVEGLTERVEGRTWKVRLPQRPTGGVHSTVIGNRGTTTVVTNGRAVQAGTVVAGVHVAGDNVVINGVRQGPASGVDTEPVRAHVRLPAHSSLRSRLTTGGVDARNGVLAMVDHHATAADLRVDMAGRLHVRTVSGDVRVVEVAGPAEVTTTSGHIDLAEVQGPVTARSTSGDITLSAYKAIDTSATSGDIRVHARDAARVRAHSMSGDVTTTSVPGVRPEISAKSVSGRVRTPA